MYVCMCDTTIVVRPDDFETFLYRLDGFLSDTAF